MADFPLVRFIIIMRRKQAGYVDAMRHNATVEKKGEYGKQAT